MSRADRVIRIGSAAALVAIGVLAGTWWLAGIGALTLVAGLYDLIPRYHRGNR